MIKIFSLTSKEPLHILHNTKNWKEILFLIVFLWKYPAQELSNHSESSLKKRFIHFHLNLGLSKLQITEQKYFSTPNGIILILLRFQITVRKLVLWFIAKNIKFRPPSFMNPTIPFIVIKTKNTFLY